MRTEDEAPLTYVREIWATDVWAPPNQGHAASADDLVQLVRQRWPKPAHETITTTQTFISWAFTVQVGCSNCLVRRPPPMAPPAAGAAIPRDALLRIAAPLRDSLAAAPYAPPEGSSTSTKSLLSSLLPSSHPQAPAGGGGARSKEAAGLLLFCAAARAASPEYPALHWVPVALSDAAAAAVEEMAAAGGWGDVGEMVVGMMPEVVPPLKDVVKATCVDTEDEEIGKEKPPKEHAVVAAHQFRWLVSQVCPWWMLQKN